MRKVFSGCLAGFLIAYILLFAAIGCAAGFGLVTPPGYSANLRTGVITSVEPGTPAARAGLRVNDQIDFSRGGWTLHLSLDRADLIAGHPAALPILRDGHATTVVLSSGVRVPSDAWSYFVTAAVELLYGGLGAGLYFMRRTNATLMLFVLACGQAIQADNLAPVRIASPGWMPFALFLGSVGPFMGQIGLLYFGMLFANKASWAKPLRYYVLVPAIALLSAAYYYHFYDYTLAPRFINSFFYVSILNWLVFAAAATAITVRVANEADSRRLAWVAVGIWLQTIVFAMFYVDQNLHAPPLGGNPVISYLFGWFLPMPFCIAYVLVRRRVIDARVVGARTVVYALLTAIPIALFSVADWVFARKLEDARLATFAEFGLAVLFGISLNSLHKRIDRFVERIVFASRHRAFQRLRHALHALASVERYETATHMLCDEVAGALGLTSAAVFMERGGAFERVAGLAWEGCADQVQADDPLVLFARSHHRVIHLGDVAPSDAHVPGGEAYPEIAVPIMQHHRTIGVAVYGKHASGEHLDGDEETLLGELAQAAAAAIERLYSAQRLKELELALALHA